MGTSAILRLSPLLVLACSAPVVTEPCPNTGICRAEQTWSWCGPEGGAEVAREAVAYWRALRRPMAQELPCGLGDVQVIGLPEQQPVVEDGREIAGMAWPETGRIEIYRGAFQGRLKQTLKHELGHLFGLTHTRPGCVMSLEQAPTDQLCPEEWDALGL